MNEILSFIGFIACFALTITLFANYVVYFLSSNKYKINEKINTTLAIIFVILFGVAIYCFNQKKFCEIDLNHVTISNISVAFDN